MPFRSLFISVSSLQKCFLPEWFSKELETDGEIIASEAARDTKPADAREVGGDCINIGQIHL